MLQCVLQVRCSVVQRDVVREMQMLNMGGDEPVVTQYSGVLQCVAVWCCVVLCDADPQLARRRAHGDVGTRQRVAVCVAVRCSVCCNVCCAMCGAVWCSV